MSADSYGALWYTPDRACRSILTVACFSALVSAGGLSSTPNCSRVLSKEIFFPESAIPISALSKLLRTDSSSNRAEVSPHSATTTPWWTIIRVVEWWWLDQACSSARPAFDHPDRSGGTRSQVAPGKVPRAARGAQQSAQIRVTLIVVDFMSAFRERIFGSLRIPSLPLPLGTSPSFYLRVWTSVNLIHSRITSAKRTRLAKRIIRRICSLHRLNHQSLPARSP